MAKGTEIITVEGEITPYDQGQMGIEESRAQAESQAGFIVAQRFPRDEDVARHKIMRACENIRLAEEAEFSFPKGGSTIHGPSIRLLEIVKQYWRNIVSGIRELEVQDDRTVMQAYCYDLETNAREERIFTVPHYIKLKNGSMKYLDDPRDLYELKFNMGSRRERACMEKIIPRHLIDEAIDVCRETVRTKGTPATPENIAKMVEVFAGIGVTEEMLERRQGKKMKAITGPELAGLRRIYKGIDDGITTPQKVFGDESFQQPEPIEDPPPTAKTKKKVKLATKKKERPKDVEVDDDSDAPEIAPEPEDDQEEGEETQKIEETPPEPPQEDSGAPGEQSFTDRLSRVAYSKNVKNKHGKEWALYLITTANGGVYRCFDKETIEKAESAVENGYLCELTYTEGRAGKKLTALELLG